MKRTLAFALVALFSLLAFLAVPGGTAGAARPSGGLVGTSSHGPAALLGMSSSDAGPEEQTLYQIQFRAQYDFLADSPEMIARVIADRPDNPSFAELGLYLTDSEWREFERRVELLSHAIDIKRAVSGLPLDSELPSGDRPLYGPAFGGIWQDQLDGGKLKVAVVAGSKVDMSTLFALVPRGAEDLEVLEVRYSYDELSQYGDLIRAVMISEGRRGAIGIDEATNTVRVYTTAAFALPAGVPSEAVAFALQEDGFYRLASSPSLAHSAANQQSGLQIGVSRDDRPGWVVACTWGFTGHTSSNTYVVTAGHCAEIAAADNPYEWEPSDSWTGYLDLKQDADSPGAWWIVNHGYTYARYQVNGVTDGARILSNDYADTNCYHSGGDCSTRIDKRLSLYGHVDGQTVCASLGMSATYRCGTVVDADFDLTEWPYFQNQVLTTVTGVEGDSGSGFKYSTTAHGILNGLFNYETQTVFTPIYYIINRLDFDLNCVESGGWWAACPIVYS